MIKEIVAAFLLEFCSSKSKNKHYCQQKMQIIKLLKRLDELELLPEPDMSAEKSLEAFWKYLKERQCEENIISGR